MITRRALLMSPLALATPAGAPTFPSARDERGFVPLFNGKNLTGWRGDAVLWRVHDGTLVGSTEGNPIQANSFLVTTREYRDFVLRLQVRLPGGNSGVQFRSELLNDWAVRGYQADIGEEYWGNLYEEAGKRGTLVDGGAKARQAVRAGDWNDLEIACAGEAIRISLNRVVTAELRDARWPTGIIGLQLHTGAPMRVGFRRIRIKALRANPAQ